MLIGFAGVAPVAIPILYGSKFAESALVVAMIGILQTARMFRVWPSTVALGQGRSGIVLAANLSRLVAFPLAFGSVALVGGLPGMLLAFIVGELIALALGIALLNRAAGATLWLGFDRFFIFVSVSAAVVGWAAAVSHPVPIMILGLSAISMAVGAWVVRRESETIGEGVGVGLRLARQLKLPY